MTQCSERRKRAVIEVNGITGVIGKKDNNVTIGL